MNRLFLLAVVMAFPVSELLGQMDSIPPEIAVFDSQRRVTTVDRLVSVDSSFFGPFSLGDSEGVPAEIADRFDRLIATVSANQKIFVRGTADPSGWNSSRYAARENHRLDLSLAQARADWAIARARPRANVQREALIPFLEHPRRGVWVYVATYTTQVVAFVTDTVIRVDTVVIRHDPESVVVLPAAQSRWQFGAGAGVASLFTDGKKFVAPGLSFVAMRDDKWFVTFTGAWRPMGSVGVDPLVPQQFSEPRPQFRDRAEALASLGLSVFPDRSWWGLAFGVQGAWETVRELDEFLERAYGLRIGPRARVLGHHLVFGADFQVSSISEFGVSDTRWEAGFAPSLIFNVTF